MRRTELNESKIVAGFLKAPLGLTKTPLEELRSLQIDTNKKVYVKRDDCTTFAMGGNKVRQLEYVVGDAISKGADTLISSAAVQSNHLRVLSAAAAKYGLKCKIVREDRVQGQTAEYYYSGNALLQTLFGAEVVVKQGNDDDERADAYLESIAETARRNGNTPYVIGGSMKYQALGALGYVEAAKELLEQIDDLKATIGTVVLPSGSAQTHAGLLVGLRTLESQIRVCGICVRRDASSQRQRVLSRAQQTASLLGKHDLIHEDDIWVSDKYLGPGYGIPADQTLRTIRHLAQSEGLLLDPVYSGKAMTGLLDLIRSKELDQYSSTIFLHTGGAPAIFGYGTSIIARDMIMPNPV